MPKNKLLIYLWTSRKCLETEKARMNPENPVKLAGAKLQAKPCPACPVGAKHRTGVRNISLAEKTIEDVLLHFGETRKVARRRYRQFVKNGVDQGKRPEFQGGGLVRPACHASFGSISRERGKGTSGQECRWQQSGPPLICLLNN